KYYSGLATYRKNFDLPLDREPQGTRFLLDFGEGVRQPLPSPPGEHNMWAYLDAPVRDAAEVYVNGKLAGQVWHPPYRIDVTAQLHAGVNELRIVVGNTAINGMAGQPLPDYRLLWAQYGKLFEPQDMQDLLPLPSGILGPVTLIESTPAQ
ncbi:MAG: glycoside hydrolase, partial [Terracidiphilus sp.]|nr:glycoside hydrolase [Terracidiphilus sp.]